MIRSSGDLAKNCLQRPNDSLNRSLIYLKNVFDVISVERKFDNSDEKKEEGLSETGLVAEKAADAAAAPVAAAVVVVVAAAAAATLSPSSSSCIAVISHYPLLLVRVAI